MSKHKFNLFSATGVEMEYMIVDRQTLDIRPYCDLLLREVTGQITADYENGPIAWSNELVNHVVELKTNGPAASPVNLHLDFYNNVLEINRLLEKYDAVLMPTGAHPWMNPHTETRIWEHEYNEIYSLYNRIFDCRGHGWSNLQSTHINLPFNGDGEFARLHAAIRMVLPLIPALAASTPVLDGRPTGFLDSRLETYRHNQSRIPSIGGRVIPEAVFSEKEYHERIFSPIMADIRPFDQDGVLDKHFLNSRGAIARFDRGAIEIRIIDIQESPAADMAVVEAVSTLLKLVVEERFGSLAQQKRWHENHLAEIFLQLIEHAENSIITNTRYLKFWGLNHSRLSAGNVWQHLAGRLQPLMSPAGYDTFIQMLSAGTLSSRILACLNNDFSRESLHRCYQKLVEALASNSLFNVSHKNG